MVAFKLQSLALALVLTGLAAGQGRAADLLPPPPPPEEVPEPVGAGWYLRGDFTESGYHRPADNTRPDPNDPGVPPLVGLRLSDSAGYGGGVGYRVNPWLRVDATTRPARLEPLPRLLVPLGLATGGNIETGRVDALTGLVTVYADLGTWWGLTPYVGGGIGFSDAGVTRAFTQTACYVDACDGVAGTGPRDAVKRPNRSLASFAYALTAGVSYALGHGLSMDAAYRYVDLGAMKAGADAYGGSTRLKDLAASEFRIGLRYDLSGLPTLAGIGADAYGN